MVTLRVKLLLAVTVFALLDMCQGVKPTVQDVSFLQNSGMLRPVLEIPASCCCFFRRPLIMVAAHFNRIVPKS
jgi:hypothetical protein